MASIDLERKIYFKEKTIDNLTFRILSVFAFLLPLFMIPGIFYHIPLAKAALLKITASVFLLVWAYYIASTRRIRWRSTPIDLPLLLFAGIAVLSSFLALNPVTSLLGSWSERFEELPSWIAYLVIFLAAVNYKGKFKRIVTTCKALVAGSVIVSLYGVFQRFGYDFSKLTWAAEGRSSATLGNPIILGGYLNLVIPLAVGLTLSARYKEEKFFWGSAAALAGLTLIFTGSRGGWVGGIIGLAAFLVLLFWKGRLFQYKKELLAVALALLLTVSIGFYAGSRVGGTAALVSRIESVGTAGGSIATRLSIWRSSLAMIAGRPLLGWGWENFRDLFGVYREEKHVLLTQGRILADRPHNQILYIAFATGLVGLLAFLWMMLVFMGVVVRNMREDHKEGSEQVLLFAGLVSAILAYLAQEQFSFSVPAVTPLFWLIVGLCLNPLLHQSDSNLVYHSVPAKSSSLLSLAATILALVLMVPTGLSLAADYNYYQGLSAVRTEGDLVAVDFYERAIRLNPLKGEYRLSLARADRRIAYDSENPIWLERVVPVLKRGIELEPESPDLYFGLSEIYYAGSMLAGISDYTLAIHWAKEGLQRLPYSEDGGVLLADGLIGEGKYDQALEELRSVLIRSPNEAKALYLSGIVLQHSGDLNWAAIFFRKALEINPGFEDARRALYAIEAPLTLQRERGL